MSYLELLPVDVLDELWKFAYNIHVDTHLFHLTPDNNYILDKDKTPCERPTTHVDCMTYYGTTPYHTRLEITRVMYSTPSRTWIIVEEFRDNIGGFGEYSIVTTYQSKSRYTLLKYLSLEYIF